MLDMLERLDMLDMLDMLETLDMLKRLDDEVTLVKGSVIKTTS